MMCGGGVGGSGGDGNAAAAAAHMLVIAYVNLYSFILDDIL